MLSYNLIYYYKQSSNDLTGISRKKSPPHLVSLIKVDPHNHSSWYKDSAYICSRSDFYYIIIMISVINQVKSYLRSYVSFRRYHIIRYEKSILKFNIYK